MRIIWEKCTPANLIRWVLKVHRYPRYISDLYCNTFYKALLCRKGCKLGNNLWLSGLPIIKRCPNSKVIIGDNVLLCSISDNTALGINHPIVMRTMKSGASIIIGNGVRMSGTSICSVCRITIGDNVVIGANVVIADTDFHATEINHRRSRVTSQDLGNAKFSPVELDSDIFIGANSAILKGVHIGKGATIGFGSVVTKNIPAYAIAVGNPAKIVGDTRSQNKT